MKRATAAAHVVRTVTSREVVEAAIEGAKNGAGSSWEPGAGRAPRRAAQWDADTGAAKKTAQQK